MIGERYVGALAGEIGKWLNGIEARRAQREPIGVAFSGGIDSGAVFLVTYHTMLKLGLSPSRLKAFVLNLGERTRRRAGPLVLVGRSICRCFSRRSTPGRRISTSRKRCASSKTTRRSTSSAPRWGCRLCRGIRERYPEWRHLADGDGGDENLKDYPLEAGGELTIRSVVDNLMLYQEGWGVGRIKHSLTYSGGLSRSYIRTYAPARRYGFEGFSPYTRPAVIEVAEGIPFASLTRVRRAVAVCTQGRDRAARREGGHRIRHAGVSEAPFSARRYFGRCHACANRQPTNRLIDARSTRCTRER